MLIGGGGHCKSVLDTALRCGRFDDILIVDPVLKAGNEIMGCLVSGDDEALHELFDKGYRYAFISAGSIKSTELRHRLFETASAIGFEFPCISDPSAIVSEYTKIEQGVFIGKNAIVNAEAKMMKK